MGWQKISWTVLEVQIVSEVDLGCSQRLMSQVELNLVDLGPIFESQLCVGAPKILGSDRKTALVAVPQDHLTNGFGTDVVPQNTSSLAHSLKRHPE
jgi:hypothetical protein